MVKRIVALVDKFFLPLKKSCYCRDKMDAAWADIFTEEKFQFTQILLLLPIVA